MTMQDQPRFCTYCAAPLKAGAPFCVECGRAVPAFVDHSGAATPVSQRCRFCGAPAEPEDRFCPVCGHAAWRAGAAPEGEAEPTSGPGSLFRRIVVIAVIVALLAGGSLGLLAPNLFGGSNPPPSGSPGIGVITTPAATFELPTLEPLPSAPPATEPETPPPSETLATSSPDAAASAPTPDVFASPSGEPASPSFGFATESPGLQTPSFGAESASPTIESPAPLPTGRTIIVDQTKTVPPAKGSFRVTFQRIDVLADGTMQFFFHAKNVRNRDDCVRLNSDGVDDFVVDSANSRYVPTGWGTAAGPLPFDQCGPIMHPGDAWDYFDTFPGLDDVTRTFDLTIYHGDLIFSGLSIAP
jgi:hypothetical protein